MKWILALGCVLALAGPARAELAIVFGEVLTAPDPETGELSSGDPASVRVVLSAQRFHVVDPEAESLYDFDTGRMFLIRRDAGGYLESPILASVSFREYELGNRRELGQMLERLEADDDAREVTDPVFAEHMLSVTARDSEPRIERAVEDDADVYRAAGHELLRTSHERVALPAGMESAVVRFFRHHYGGHPQIVGAVANADGIPRRVVLHDPMVGARWELTVESVGEVAAGPDPLAGLERIHHGGPRLQALLAMAPVPRDRCAAGARDLFGGAIDAGEDGRLLVSLLLFLESTQFFEPAEGPWTDEVRARIGQSPEVARCMQMVQNQPDEESARRAVAELARIRDTVGEAGRVLRVYEANTRYALGETEAAHALMLDALEANPCMVGAWKDLGDFAYREFDTYAAWACWEVALALNPEHTILESVAREPARLTRRYPGLF